jgi:glycerol 3-phosphatase-2
MPFYRAGPGGANPPGVYRFTAPPGACGTSKGGWSSVAARPLAGRYGGVVLDCDGVLYLRDQAIPAAQPALAAIRALGVRVAFVTNNSTAPPAAVAGKLRGLGLAADPAEVATSAQAVVRLLGGPGRLAGERVLVVGGHGLRQALAEAGAELLAPDEDWRVATVVAVGLDTDLTYDRARRAALAIHAGARFVGSNPDASLPTAEGPWPGAGSLLAMLQAATGRRPQVAGKPEPPLLEAAAHTLGAGPYLMVGDRADTDVVGAERLGWDSALVLTGVTRTEDLPGLPVVPTWLLRDLGGLLDPVPATVRPAGRDERDAAARLLGGAGPVGELGEVVVAVTGRQLAGAVAWSLRDGRAHLRGPLVVAPARGALTGTRLLVAAGVRARRAGARSVSATADAPGFLARLGFRAGGDGRWTRPLGPAPAQLR